MKVTFSSYDFVDDISGVSSWILRLLPLLRGRGLDVHAHLFQIGEGRGATATALADCGVPVQSAPWPSHSEAGTRQCLTWLAARLPDVYVPNCIVPAYHAARFVKRAGVATVGVLHSDLESKDALLEEFVTGPVERRVDAMVAVSSRLESMARAVAPAGVRVRRIPCGVPFPGTRATAPDGMFRLVYAGRLTEEAKRIGDVTRALVKATERWLNVEAWLIGDGPARASVETIVAASPARSRVRLLGRQPPREIQTLMQQCHGFVLLSDYEGLPVSMLEAMAVGVVPIVHQAAGAVAEVLVDGKNGFVVSDRDADFLHAIESLRSDPERWRRMATAARATVEAEYSVQRGADGWCELLGELARGANIDSNWKPPARIRLPRPNAKFGWFDARRPSRAKRLWIRTRMSLGRYRASILQMLRHADR